jgi:hypothetical protein
VYTKAVAVKTLVVELQHLVISSVGLGLLSEHSSGTYSGPAIQRGREGIDRIGLGFLRILRLEAKGFCSSLPSEAPKEPKAHFRFSGQQKSPLRGKGRGTNRSKINRKLGAHHRLLTEPGGLNPGSGQKPAPWIPTDKGGEATGHPTQHHLP